MHRRTLPFPLLLAILLITSLFLVACGGAAATGGSAPAEPEVAAEVEEAPAEEAPAESGEMAEEGMLPEIDPFVLEGDIIVSGSSTVFPLTEAMAERFTDEGYTGEITVDSIGTGAGFERFCVNTETDIANASRAIKDEEAEACKANGLEPLEFRVGTDALAVVVSAENDFVDNLTLEQLAQIYTGKATTWAEVDPSWPAEEIQLYSPGTDSGTFDFFVEFALDKDEEGILGTSNIQFSEDDNVLVQGVEGSPNAIGYFGYAYYQENADKLKVLTIDGIEPNGETAESGEYPLSRPLFIYSAATILAEKPQVAGFINFFLSYVNEEVEEVGYFPASEESLNEARQLFVDATTIQ